MTTTVDGALGVTTPKLTLTGAGTNSLLPATSGTWTQTLPSGNGTLVLSTVTLNMPTTLGSSGDVLTTNGSGTLTWAPAGGSSSLAVGTTPIASGTTGSLLINTSGVLQQIVMGSGVPGALANGTNAAGGLLVANGSGVLPVAQGGTGLGALGTAGQVLTVNPGATALTWATPASTSLTVGTTTIASGTTGSILLNTSGVLQQIVLGTNVASGLAAAAGGANGFALLNGSGVLPTTQGGVGGALNAGWTPILSAAPGTGVGAALGNATNGASGLAVLDGSGLLPIAKGGTGLGVVAANGQTLVSNGTTYAAGYPAQATNISGGGAWQIPYQSATNTTAFAAAGTTDQILSANTGAAPSWINNSVKLGTTVVKVGDATATTVINDITTLKLTQDPTSGLEAATKQYVDAKTSGLNDVGVVKAATTADITRSGPQTIDTISVVATDLVLVKNQTLPQENGVYEVQAGSWTYAGNANTWSDYPSAVVFVQQGATNANTSWIQTNTSPTGTLGTTTQTWAIQSSPVTSYSAGTGININVNQISNTGVLSIAGGATGLTFGTGTGAITVGGQLAVGSGGTGLAALGTGVQTALGLNMGVANGFAALNGSGVLPVAQGGTGLASGTSGGVPYYSATTTLASSALLAANALMVGGGAGAAPSTVTTGANVLTALSNDAGTANGFALLNGSGVLTTAQGGVGGALNSAWTAILGAAPGTGVGAALGNNTNAANGLAVLNGSGVLPIAQGGTGLSSLGTAGQVLTVNPGATAAVWATPSLTVGTTAIGSGTTGSLLIDTAGVLQEITMGTGVSGALANATNAANGLLVANGSGVLPIAQGGTNAATATAALNNLLPTQTAANQDAYLTTDGAGTISWSIPRNITRNNYIPYTTSGTYTPSPQVRAFSVVVLGSTGGIGGPNGPKGGQGGPGYSEKTYTSSFSGTYTVTVGAGGTTAGTAGGDTSFQISGVGPIVVSSGPVSSVTGGTGGTASGGDVNFTGGNGGDGNSAGVTSGGGGGGAASRAGNGGNGGTGVSGVSGGGGGTGGNNASGSTPGSGATTLGVGVNPDIYPGDGPWLGGSSPGIGGGAGAPPSTRVFSTSYQSAYPGVFYAALGNALQQTWASGGGSSGASTANGRQGYVFVIEYY